MKLYESLAVGSGAAVGAWFRWRLGAALNPVFPTLPLGTLALRQQYGWALAEISIHVVGSLALTVLGIFIVRFFLAKGGL